MNGKRATDWNSNDDTVTICDSAALEDGLIVADDVPVHNPPITAVNTVSRFASRILVDGKSDEGRVYAGAFDQHGILNIGVSPAASFIHSHRVQTIYFEISLIKERQLLVHHG